MTKRHFVLCALIMAAFAMLPQSGQAGTTYTAFSGLTPLGSADITLSGNTITVVLTDLVVNPGSVASNMSAIQINLSSSVTVTAESNSAFTERTVNSDKTFSDTARSTSDQTGWVLQTATSSKTMSALQLDVLADGAFGKDPVTGFTHGGPDDTLIGSPDPAHPTKYSAAAGSIAGNGPHNPFIAGSFTETFTVSSLAGITINSVYLQFGTTDNTFTPTVPTEDHHDVQPTPEPGSLIVWSGLGLAGVGLVRRRRKAA